MKHLITTLTQAFDDGGLARNTDKSAIQGVDEAEFENMRKRLMREKEDVREYAAMDTIRSLLPVVDDFERALDALTLMLGYTIPLVHRNYDGAAAIQHQAHERHVLVSQTLMRVHQRHHNVGNINRLQRLDDTEFLDALVGS